MSATWNRNLIRPLIATVLGLTVVSACSTAPVPGRAAESSAGESSTVRAPSTSTAAVTTSPGPSSTAPLPAAADGAGLDACRDGTCEVLVTLGSQIPFPRRADIVAEVEAIGGGQVRLTGTWPGGHIESSGDCASCSASITSATRTTPGSFDVHLTAGGGVRMNGYALDVVALDQDEAVVRMHPA